MAVITLTTDLGTKDFYQAAIKGRLLTLLPQSQIIDITHEIPAFDIAQAALVLKNAFHFFPKGSIHIVGVNPIYKTQAEFLVLKYREHYFVGANNGLFSLVCEEAPEELVEVDIPQNFRWAHFPVLDVFVETVAKLLKNKMDLSKIGPTKDKFDQVLHLEPSYNQNSMTAAVIYIDHFHNVITNVTQKTFEQVQKGRKFIIRLGRNETIDRLSWDYNDQAEGDKLCLFGISGYLEIALNRANAEQLLGLKVGSKVRIDFFD